MKIRFGIPLFSMAIAVVSAPVIRADSEVQIAVAKLRDQRDKALATYFEALDKDYKARLDALQKRAMAAGDLDAALAIRNELAAPDKPAASSSDATSAVPPASSDIESFRRALLAGSWRWGHDGGSSKRFTFIDDGRTEGSSLAWKIVNAHDLKVWSSSAGESSFWLIRFSDDFKSGRGISALSAIKDADAKYIRPDTADGSGEKSEKAKPSTPPSEKDSDNTPFGRRTSPSTSP